MTPKFLAEHYNTEYRGDIDGLRAIAVLSVLFFHAGFSGFRGGFTGVDVFFTISGFLIGGHIYAREQLGRFSFADFYRRRATRILPALYVVICATLFLGSALLSPSELRRASTEAIAVLLSGSNFFFWKVTDYFAVASDQRTLLMTWSLGVEEQFYLAVPLLMIWLMRLRIRLEPVLAILAVLSFAAACYQAHYAPVTAFYLLPARAWELLAGVLLAVRNRSDRPRRLKAVIIEHFSGGLGLLLILSAIFLFSPATPFPGIGALPSVVGTALVLSAPASWFNKRILCARSMRFLGRISYSLYLWHWPLLTFTRILLGANPSRPQAAAVLAISVLFAVASYYMVELPFRGAPASQRQVVMRYATSTALMIVVCFGFRTTYGLAFRAPRLAVVEKKLDAVHPDPCLVSDPVASPNPTMTCFETGAKPAVAIWGDSHAGSLAMALREKAHSVGYIFIETSKSACPPLANAGRYFHQIPSHAEQCIAFNNEVLRRLQSDTRVKEVLLTARWRDSLAEPYTKQTGWIVEGDEPNANLPDLGTSERRLRNTLLHTILALQKSGKRVFVLQDVPEFDKEPIWHVRTSGLDLRRWLMSRLHAGRAIDNTVDIEGNQAADELARTIIIDVTQRTGAGPG